MTDKIRQIQQKTYLEAPRADDASVERQKNRVVDFTSLVDTALHQRDRFPFGQPHCSEVLLCRRLVDKVMPWAHCRNQSVVEIFGKCSTNMFCRNETAFVEIRLRDTLYWAAVESDCLEDPVMYGHPCGD